MQPENKISPIQSTYHRVDVDKLTSRGWLNSGNNTPAPIFLAFLTGQANDIPTKLLTRARMSTQSGIFGGLTLLEIAVVTDNLSCIPEEALSPKMFSSTNKNGTTPLHLAAEFNRLKTIPRNILSSCEFNVEDSKGVTPLAVALANGSLECIPTTALTLPNLLQPDKRGITPLHRSMAHLKVLRDFIADALQPQYMPLMDIYDRTPLYFAAYHNTISFLPPDCLRPALLSIKTNKETPIELQLRRNLDALHYKIQLKEYPFTYLQDVELSKHIKDIFLRNWNELLAI